MRAVITRDLRLEGGGLVRNAEFLRFAPFSHRSVASSWRACTSSASSSAAKT
jgi:hypothetical protein